MTHNKGQGAIEYLLIIGVVIIIVAVTIIALSGVLTETRQSIDKNEINAVNDPLRNLLNNPVSTDVTPNLNDPIVYYLELISLDPITLGELLRLAPIKTTVEIESILYIKDPEGFICFNPNYTPSDSLLVQPGTKFKLSLINSANGFDINEDTIGFVSKNYAELTLSVANEETYLYFTPTPNSIAEMFPDAPNNAYISIQNAETPELLASYRKTNGIWNKEYSADNGLFDIIEQSDKAIMTLGLAPSYSKKVTGEINPNFDTQIFIRDEINDEEMNYVYEKVILGSAIQCYDINKLFNKIETQLVTNFNISVAGCSKNKSDGTIMEGNESYLSCQTPNKSINSSNPINLEIFRSPGTPIPPVNFNCD